MDGASAPAAAPAPNRRRGSAYPMKAVGRSSLVQAPEGAPSAAWADELAAFYTAHLGDDDGQRASKIAQIPTILEHYAGDEIELMAQLHAKYGVPIPRDKWWAAEAVAHATEDAADAPAAEPPGPPPPAVAPVPARRASSRASQRRFSDIDD